MFWIVILFVMFGGLFAIFRYPNFLSRYIKIDFARFFKNPKLKILFKDLNYFNANINKISKKPLFIVAGKNSDQVYKALVAQNQSSPSPLQSQIDSEEAFELCESSDVCFLFINKTLIEKDFQDSSNSRLRWLIKRIAKARRRNFLEGFIFLPDSVAYKNLSVVNAEIADEITFFTNLFSAFTKVFKIRFPVYFLEHDFESDQKQLVRNIFKQVQSYEEVCLGFSCDFEEKLPGVKLHDYLKKSYAEFKEAFDHKTKLLINDKSDEETGLSSIQLSQNVKTTVWNFFKNYFYHFLQPFEKDHDLAPGALTILNSDMFAAPTGTAKSECVHYAFDYVATKGINKSIISNELLYNKHRINILVSVLTGFLLVFGSYAFYRSVVFLRTTRSEFVQLSGNLRAVVADLNSSLNSEKVDPVKLEAIQEKTCSLVRNYTFVKDIGFYTPYLFPSWFSSLSTDLQKQYRDRFSASFSSFLIKKYTGLLDSQLSFDPSTDRSYTEISKSFYSFSDFMYNFSDFYAKITARNSKDYDAAIYVISKLVYGNSCTDTLKADGFLSKVDPDALEELKKKYSSVKVRATNVLAERANEYFSAMINKHPLLYDSKIIQGAIDNFNDYGNKFVNNSGSSAHSDNGDRFQVISKAFVDLVGHYKALSDSLASHADVTSSQEKFFGDEFKTAKDEIIKNPMFDPSSISDITNSAIITYAKFQKQLSELMANTSAHYPVLFVGDSKDPTKAMVSVNPDVVQLFNALGDINGMYLATLGKNTADSSEAPFGNDLFAIAKILPKNASWVSDKLQSFIQRNANFQKNYSMLDFTSYPDVFANNLRDYVNNFSQAYWNQALCSSLIKTLGNSSVNRKNKPKWSDENSDDEFMDDPDISDDDDGSIDYLGLPASAPSLANITNILRRQRVKELASALELIYKSQADAILKKLYNSFEKRGYFGAGYGGFDWWNGDASPAYAIFNVTSDDGLRTTLDSQKARVQDYYNQNIASIMNNFAPLFQSSRFDALYYSRWKSIADVVAQDSKSNTFQAFSTYVTGSLSRFRTDSCGDVLFNYMDAGNIPDYFDARVQSIKKQLYDRCRVIYMGIAIASHDDFARYFNQTFAGRFPFTQPGSFTGSTDLSDLQTGLGLYDNLLSGKVRFLEKESTQYNSKPEAKDFNRKMAAATAFFNLAKSKDGDTVGIPQFNIVFKFRSNKREEVFANQIVNWKMQVGRQLYGSEYGQLQDANFLWRYGDVIKLSFSLPNDGSYDLSDDNNDNDSNKFTSDNTINYVFNENWSLLKLIFKYNRCTQIDRTKCANYQTLKFSIPIGKNKNLVVYCDISLFDSNNNKVDIPTFPYKAVPIKN